MTLAQGMSGVQPEGPSIFQAIWRHKLPFLLSVAIAAFLGFLYASQQPDRWVATSSMVVEDPEIGTVFAETASARRPERYVENQVEIIRSDAVARSASELLASASPPIEMSPKSIATNLSVEAALTNDLIKVTLEGNDPGRVIAGVDAVVAAYSQIRATEAKSNLASALEQVDGAIVAIEAELDGIDAAIASISDSRPAARELLVSQYEETLQRLSVVEDLDELAEPVERDLLLFRLDALQRVLAIETAQEDALVAPLLGDQALANERLQSLSAQRDQLSVDSQLTSAGVLFVSPAQEADKTGLDLGVSVPIAVLLGAAVGSAISYGLALRRRTFSTRLEPEAVLGAPPLAAIPHFAEERIPTDLAVAHAPNSVTAESFRFVAAALEAHASRTGQRSFVFVSADVGDGKTAVVANTALVAARGGKRVLVIDADFGAQDLSRMLGARSVADKGMTNIAVGESSSSGAIWQVSVADRPPIYVLGRGTADVSAADLFSTDLLPRLLDELSQYDLILIDCPPLLQVAYASALTGHADRVVVVIPHGSSVPLIEEVRDRLDLVGTPIFGYVYNAAPLRKDLQRSGASLLDTQPTAASSGIR